MTAFPVIGLGNIGNICFVNSMFQCFASVKSIEDFMQVELDRSNEEHGFLFLVQEELRRMKNEKDAIWLKKDLLYYIYFQIFHKKYNSQQDISELIMEFFEHLKQVAPHVYFNFGVMATNSFPDVPIMNYTLNLSVSPDESLIDIGEKLSNAVFLEYDQVCTCGQQDRVHFYGEVPKCLIITVHKIAGYDRVNECEIIRRDVQIKCQPTLRINGQEYEMKSAVQYVGSTGKGGGIGKGLRKLLCIPKKSYKKLNNDDLTRNNLQEYRRAAADESVNSSPPKSEPMLEAENTPPNHFKYSSPILKSSHVQFRSSARNLPHMNNLSGHYTSYVKRGDDFFYISDDDVNQTSVVHTGDLSVLFYERK